MPNTSVDPYALLQRGHSEPAALDELARQEHGGLLDWLTHVLRDRDCAEDAVQDTWVVLSQGQWQFTPQSDDTAGDVRAWLRRIALRSALRRRQQNQARQRLFQRWSRQRNVATSPCPLHDLDQKDRSTILQAALAELPSHMRHAIELRYRDGLAFPDMARKLGSSTVAARVQTWRALRMLRSRLLGIGVLLSGSCTSWACDMFPSSSNTIAVSSNVMWFAWSPATTPLVAVLSGVVLSGLTLCYFAFSETAPISFADNSSASQATEKPASASQATEKSASDSQIPAWLYIGDNESSGKGGFGLLETDILAEEIPDVSGKQILVDVSIISEDFTGEQVSFASPTVISAEQGDRICARAAKNSSLMSAPSVSMLPRKTAEIATINQFAYIAGYKLVKESLDPTINISNLGQHIKLSADIENEGVRILSTHIDHTEKIACPTRTTTALRLGKPYEYPWEEPVIRHQSSAQLPQEGIVVPAGAYLLVPLNKSERRYHTPNRRYTEPDTNPGQMWILFKPSVTESAQTDAPARPIDSI